MQDEPQNPKSNVGDLPVSFSQLILGFSSAALHHLGEQSSEAQSKQRQHLALAKHNIAIIDLLLEKTQGNLDAEEEKLIHHVLTDLKMKFVSAAKNQESSQATKPNL